MHETVRATMEEKGASIHHPTRLNK